MLTILMAIAITILAVAMVALFAMMGELASKVEATRPARGGSDVDEWAQVLKGFTFHKVPGRWPQALHSIRGASRALVVILSTSCRTCDYFAEGRLQDLDSFESAFILSCSSEERARAFIEAHPQLNHGRPLFVDEGGSWIKEELGLETSPSAVLLEHDQPRAAFLMSSPASLAVTVNEYLKAEGGSLHERFDERPR